MNEAWHIKQHKHLSDLWFAYASHNFEAKEKKEFLDSEAYKELRSLAKQFLDAMEALGVYFRADGVNEQYLIEDYEKLL